MKLRTTSEQATAYCLEVKTNNLFGKLDRRPFSLYCFATDEAFYVEHFIETCDWAHILARRAPVRVFRSFP